VNIQPSTAARGKTRRSVPNEMRRIFGTSPNSRKKIFLIILDKKRHKGPRRALRVRKKE
jgi:hypothetical protein